MLFRSLYGRTVCSRRIFASDRASCRSHVRIGSRWILTSKEEIENSPVIEGFNNIQPGDIKYKDLNGDKVINEFDRTVIGGDKPYSYFGIDLGFEWKGLEFSMLWQGAYNRDYYLGDVTLTEGFQQNGQFYGQAYENMLGRWTPETAETATFPRLTAGGNNYNRGNGWNSSFWLRSEEHTSELQSR